jgi:carboxyl-terminal processing protease
MKKNTLFLSIGISITSHCLAFQPSRVPLFSRDNAALKRLDRLASTPLGDLPLKPDQKQDDSSMHVPYMIAWETTKKSFATASMAALLMTATLATPWQIDLDLSLQKQPLESPSISITLTKSRANALTEEQALVDDVWKEVNRQFFDRTFHGMGEEGWKKQRLDSVKKVTGMGPDDQEQVYKVIRKMLETLGDPYTRYLTPDQYESLYAYAKGGASSGIGVQLLGDPSSGKIVVINTVKDGPAQKAGVLPGDIIVQVDGYAIDGATAEVVAAKCRGDMGTEVTLAIRHGGDGKPEDKVSQIPVTRASIKNNPVETSIITVNGKQVGLIKLSSFSQETVSQVTEALNQVKSKTSALVLDLRGNGGGYMPAGVDVAKMFLAPNARVISEVDKSDRATIYINDGVGSETEMPLYLLVDKRTASASEILTAALQDNRRAIVVGTKTFGKGRIQNVQPLSEGGVAVTKAKYITPDGRDIHGVGISPDKETSSCGPSDSAVTCLTGII